MKTNFNHSSPSFGAVYSNSMTTSRVAHRLREATSKCADYISLADVKGADIGIIEKEDGFYAQLVRHEDDPDLGEVILVNGNKKPILKKIGDVNESIQHLITNSKRFISSSVKKYLSSDLDKVNEEHLAKLKADLYEKEFAEFLELLKKGIEF